MAPSAIYEGTHPVPQELEVTISEYIYTRILQLGVKSVFGVPGDFVLDFCEEVSKTPEINWVGTCNELNGAYLADAYAKMSGKIGVFVSTYGVGELSAINAISGAFLEFAPVLHIVGTSSRQQKQTQRQNLHHLIPKRHSKTPDHYVYEKIVDDFCIVKESLWDVESALRQIDNAIENVYQHSRPGYIYLPSDMATKHIPASRLYKPLDLCLRDCKPELTEKCALHILDKLYNAQNPVIMVDFLTRAFRQQLQVEKLITMLQDKVNFVSTVLSKGVVLDEYHPRFAGIYLGALTPDEVTKNLIEEKLDFVLDIGSFDVQNNNGGFTARYQNGLLVELNHEYCSIDGDEYEAHFVYVLDSLIKLIDLSKVSYTNPVSLDRQGYRDFNVSAGTDITQDFLAERLQGFLKPNDVMVVETCSFLFCVPDIKFAPGVRLLSQNFYNSIGYLLPLSLGAALANRENGISESDSRIIVLQGDGSLLMTLQELSTFMRQDVKLTFLLMNNDGYTIERAIMGENSLYNDIAPHVQWTKLFGVLGDVEGKTNNLTLNTRDQLMKFFGNGEINDGSKLQMVEMILDRLDAPARFKRLIGK